MKKFTKQFCKVLILFVLFVQTFANVGFITNDGQYVQASTSNEQYGLPAKTEDGVILHAWNWSFDAIRSRLPEIAAAGYKTIQTSPIQGSKEALMEGSKWWVLYQPINFSIGNAQLGTREQFRLLCEEAEKYGINIIVDVVANHTGNAGGGNLQYQPAYNVDPSIRNNSSFWHEARGVDNWNDRWQVTQWGIGLPDLNTGNPQLQGKIIDFLNDAISLGADGFRFDAAKHIELPTDQYGASNFWPNVLGSLNNRDNLYIYGEILQGGADAFAQYANYMDVTASFYGDNIRHAVGFNSSKNVNLAKDFNAAGVSPSKLVTWVESHDTYANDGNESTYMNDWQIKMGWAMIASRAQTVSLFFNRPAGNGKFAQSLGTPGNDMWKDPDVVAVNKFRNAMAGQGEYLRNQGNDILLVERGTKGMTIVNLGGDAFIDQPTNLANGVYTNKATGGGTFTVANGRITGNIGGGKIAVLYDQQQPQLPAPVISINKNEGNFSTDTLAVTISLQNANSASYTINGGSPVSIQSGATVTLGAGASAGTTFNLTVTAVGSSTVVKTYTFTKVNSNEQTQQLVVHYYKPSSWGQPNIYYYDDSAGTVKQGPAWPGTAMTNEGNGWYSYTIEGWDKARVIFNSNGQQVPGAQQAGYLVTSNVWIKDGQISTTAPGAPEEPVTQQLVVHYYKPSSWGQPNIYYYDDSAGTVKQGPAWPGTPMTNEGDGWYTYTIQGWNKARVIFNSNGQQTPGAQQAGYLVTSNVWIKDGQISTTAPDQNPGQDPGEQPGQQPDNNMVNVTFQVHNATTFFGQNVYLVGDIAELGNWNTQNAVGPGSTSNYPTWTFTVSLPAGTTIQFKAIKRDGNNNVVWESGSNHSYTVSANNPNVSFSFRN